MLPGAVAEAVIIVVVLLAEGDDAPVRSLEPGPAAEKKRSRMVEFVASGAAANAGKLGNSLHMLKLGGARLAHFEMATNAKKTSQPQPSFSCHASNAA